MTRPTAAQLREMIEIAKYGDGGCSSESITALATELLELRAIVEKAVTWNAACVALEAQPGTGSSLEEIAVATDRLCRCASAVVDLRSAVASYGLAQ